MKTPLLLSMLLIVVCGAGCSAAKSTTGNIAAKSGTGGTTSSAGSGGGGGRANLNLDAAADAGPTTRLSPNLDPNPPTFNWDASSCSGCGAGGSASQVVDAGAGEAGTPFSRDARADTSAYIGHDGATGMGGSSGSAGAVGTGGSFGAGGSSGHFGTGGIGGAGGGSTGVGGMSGLGGSADGGIIPPASGCEAELVAVVPTKNWFGRLIAGPSVQVVLRAAILSGGDLAGVRWTWQGAWNGSALPVAGLGSEDRAEAAFPIVDAGTYEFVATDNTGACRASVKTAALPASSSDYFDNSVLVRSAPPPGSNVPVQSGSLTLIGGPPFASSYVGLADGLPVSVQPDLGGKAVVSYVRINNIGTAAGGLRSAELVTEGMADQNFPFSTRLIAVDIRARQLLYDVLVVPLDGSAGGAVAATAPQLFQNLTANDIRSKSFGLAGGLKVAGSIVAAGGKGVEDARVVMSNQDPTGTEQPSLVFSSVGRGDAQGNYELHTRPGSYWVSISPPAEAGLPLALAPEPISFVEDATLDFQWDLPTPAAVTLKVTDAGGVALAEAKVRLTSMQQSRVGVLTVRSQGGGATMQTAMGHVQVQGTTSQGGRVTFSNVPADSTYELLLVPATLGPQAATTAQTLKVGAGATTQTVQLWPESHIHGRLVADAKGAPDFTQVVLVAHDRSADSPEAPRTVTANSDGSFSIGVSPGRPYVVVAEPPTGTGWARTFVGPGPLEASEFTITQKMPRSRDWISTVVAQSGEGVPGTSLQVLCEASWPYCLDPGIPLAETTSGDGGSFHLDLPDPTR